ncbi:MAG: hypothetical protein JSV65_00615 [Armatimonadota bacterium]|nr:MAG: hypothetical protein JSV65_00615 [Armatimonadota bacterium]
MSDKDDKVEQPDEARGDGAFGMYSERLPELEPTEFHEGFTLRTMLGAFFVGFIMMPGAIYLGLMVGQELGPAAEWTTIILFAEIARRSFTPMRRQELYLIYYMAAALAGGAGGLALGGGPFAGLIWAQYVRTSPAAVGFGIADQIPNWWAPPGASMAIAGRSFLHPDWTIPIVLLLIGQVLGRMQWIGLGYILFRSTSDVERLPFPYAPVTAQGATALAEVTRDEESWRWPVFSVGAMIGLSYGVLYVLVPTITGALFAEPIQLIKIPFIDLTPNTEGIFPAGKIAIGTDLGAVLVGFILPLPIAVGQFITAIFANFLFTPTLYHLSPEAFPSWRPGMSVIQTDIATGIDFWMSVGIGVAVSFALIGFGQVISSYVRKRTDAERRAVARRFVPPPPGRGDFPLWIAAIAWLISAVGIIVMANVLVPRFPLWILIVFGLVWSPINSYISARLIGLTTRGIGIPYLAQASFILSGYRGVDIWFAPIPLYDHGWAAQRFREVELTGTKFTSVIKAEAFLLVLLIVCSFLFWSFFWRLGPIPSSSYPYAQTFWPLNATWTCLWATATRGGAEEQWLLKALKPNLMGIGLGGSLGLYGVLALARTPIMWFYGMASGFTGPTHGAIPIFIGAMLGRYYFRRRFGLHRWRLYAPVLLAGYACGQGLMGMLGIAIAIIMKSVRVLPY